MSGLAFPYAIATSGRTAAATPADDLANMVLQVLLTPLGARINRPDFGSRLDQMVFAGAGPEIASAIELMVRSALTEWLIDRLAVDSVLVAAGDGRINIALTYAAAPGAAPIAQTVTLPLAMG